jgi:hypothetical protein
MNSERPSGVPPLRTIRLKYASGLSLLRRLEGLGLYKRAARPLPSALMPWQVTQ